MKRLIPLVLLMFALPAYAGSPTFEQITVAASSIGITSTIITPLGLPEKQSCMLTLETAEIRWRVDGLDPTAAVGHVMSTGGVLYLTRHSDMVAFRAIRTGGSSGKLSVTCWD